VTPRVLVTGAAGFIGSHVVDALVRHGVEPVGLVRPGIHGLADVEYVEADYRDPGGALRSVAPDVLVHAAWRLAPGTAYLDDPANNDEMQSSLRLFTHAAELGCRRVVGIGTCLEYEEKSGPAREDTPLAPRTVYATSKAELFTAAEAWAESAAVSFAWARLYYPFGPREPAHRLIPSVTNALLRGERVATTEGSQRWSFLVVEDVADAIAATALSDVGGAVNVGSADALSVREVVERIAAVLDGADLLDIGALATRPDEPKVLWPDTTRLTEEVGWSPSATLQDALKQTVDWWRR
jgi:nucleoside-diphosphate-sugar epimerase